MAKATTQKFSELVLETSDDGGTTWTRICGMVDASITRAAQLDSAEIPDCNDDSLPLSVEKSVRSIEVSVSATGVWAQESHGTLMDWFYSSASKDVRVGNLNVAVGDTEYETGVAYLANLSNERTKGQKVTASHRVAIRWHPDPDGQSLMQSADLSWIGGEHPFCLAIGNLRAIQKVCEAGPQQVLERLGAGTWRIDDLFEVIRQGLIGGGMASNDASDLLARLFDQHPLLEFVMTARAVLASALIGVEDDPVGEAEGEAPPPENGASQSTTEPEL